MPALRIRVGFVVKPRMKSFLYNSAMPSRSAPSAKILIGSCSSKTVLIDDRKLIARLGSARKLPFEKETFHTGFLNAIGYDQQRINNTFQYLHRFFQKALRALSVPLMILLLFRAGSWQFGNIARNDMRRH